MQGMRGVIALMDYNVRATRKLRNCSRDPREKLVQLMRMCAQQWERALFEGETGRCGSEQREVGTIGRSFQGTIHTAGDRRWA